MKNILFLILPLLFLTSCSNSNSKYAKNLATAKQLFKLHGEENIDEQLKLVSKDIKVELPFYGSDIVGYETYTSMLKGYHDAFDDINYTAELWLPGTDSLGVLNGSVRTYGKWTGIQVATGKQLNLKGYWYFGFDDQGLLNAQGDFFDAGGMLNAVYPKNLVYATMEVLPGKTDQVMEILNSKTGLPATRAYDGCLSVELTFNEENNAETKASFSNALAERAKSKKGPTTERAKYQISKNNIKNGFCSKRFIIYGENKKEFENLLAYSPLHNIKKGECYPATLITTAERDDRVVPSHSFKFAAKLQEYQGCDKPILIRIEDRAGHGAGTPKDKQINQIAEIYGYALSVING